MCGRYDLCPFFPGESPVFHGFKNGDKCCALLGELIGEVFASVGSADAGDDVVHEETAEAIAEDIGGDAFGG